MANYVYHDLVPNFLHISDISGKMIKHTYYDLCYPIYALYPRPKGRGFTVRLDKVIANKSGFSYNAFNPVKAVRTTKFGRLF